MCVAGCEEPTTVKSLLLAKNAALQTESETTIIYPMTCRLDIRFDMKIERREREADCQTYLNNKLTRQRDPPSKKLAREIVDVSYVTSS